MRQSLTASGKLSPQTDRQKVTHNMRLTSRRLFRVALPTALVFACWASPSQAGYVNFETVPNPSGPPTIPHEGLAINTQYAATQGMTFYVEGPGGQRFDPLIVQRGGAPDTDNVRAGFQGVGDGDSDPPGWDQPADPDLVGEFYINNSNLVQSVAPLPFVVAFDGLMGVVAGVILDIDNNNEVWLVEALNSQGVAVASRTFAYDDPVGVGNGVATPWQFQRIQQDIASVRLTYIGTTAHDVGYAFDNFFSSAAVPEPSTINLLLSGALAVIVPTILKRRRAAAATQSAAA